MVEKVLSCKELLDEELLEASRKAGDICSEKKLRSGLFKTSSVEAKKRVINIERNKNKKSL